MRPGVGVGVGMGVGVGVGAHFNPYLWRNHPAKAQEMTKTRGTRGVDREGQG